MDSNNLSLIMAKRLKALRIGQGREGKPDISHIGLSEKLNSEYGISISKDSLQNYEVSDAYHTKAFTNNGMNVEYLRCIADYYKVSADYLLGLSDIPSPDESIQGVCNYTGLSQKAVAQILDLKNNFGNISLISAFLESESFKKAVHKMGAALSCKTSPVGRIRESLSEEMRSSFKSEDAEKDISEYALRAFSRYSEQYAIAPRLELSNLYLTEAIEYFKEAAREAITAVEENHSMDSLLLQIAKIELEAFTDNTEV